MNTNPYTLSSIDRRTFLASTAALAAALAGKAVAAPAVELPPMLGPLIGPVDAHSAMFWLRPDRAGEYVLELTVEGESSNSVVRGIASEENDLCIHWDATGLRPATAYRYRILADGQPVAASPEQRFTTAILPETPGRVRLAISSCAKEDAGSRSVWKQMAVEKADAVVLIGDTPYIDSTELEVQTRRHREFAAVSEYQSLLQSRPCWWTWDDHDFATNNCSGLAPGKENSRLVYSRYRPQKNYGDGSEGIYTSFRYGPVEIFLLDTRWFSMTASSYAGPGHPTLLGEKQWQWLQQGLLASTAPFKLLACGMIWDDKESIGSDDWGTYPHERKALEKFIVEHRLTGIVLVGGDIHASRVLRYKTEKTVGYNLVQFIASPIHAKVLPSLNVYNPDLVRSAVEPNVFLLLDVDSTVSPPTLKGTLINGKGEQVFSYSLNLTELSPT